MKRERYNIFIMSQAWEKEKYLNGTHDLPYTGQRSNHRATRDWRQAGPFTGFVCDACPVYHWDQEHWKHHVW